MKKTNMVVFGLVGVLTVVFAVSAFLLFRGISQFSKAEKNLKRSVGTLRNYYARDPFPSLENVEREKENAKVLRGWLAALSASLCAGQIEPIQKTPSNFVRLFSQTREDLKALADQHQTELPDDFAFGFERYAVSGALPAPADVPRLAQQLIIADQLCRILFESGAARVDQMRREEFESAGESGAGSSGRPAVRPGRPGRPSVAASPQGGERPWHVTGDAGVLAKDDMYARLRFGLAFEAREDALMTIMNQLAAHDMFAVVTLLDVEKKADDVRAPSALGQPVGEELGAGNAQYPPRSQRLMSGKLLEQPMRVRMEVEVYRFAELAGGKDA